VVDVVAGYGGGVELAGVLQAEPFEHLLVLLVVGVGEDRFEVGVSPGATAVFRRARSLRGDEDRVVGVGVGVQQIFDEYFVLPVVAEVIGVSEASADVGELVECDGARRWCSASTSCAGSSAPTRGSVI
jgi:hypothetical protein